LDNKGKDEEFWTEQQQTFPESSQHLIPLTPETRNVKKKT
jgi:hypothetical protein